jgi:hypothetical protein
MKTAALVLALGLFAGCTPAPSASVIALANRLAGEGGTSPQDGDRERYVACGTEALSGVPADDISQALKAPDAPSRWAILGDAALDRYVQVCRAADLKAGLRPKQ